MWTRAATPRTTLHAIVVGYDAQTKFEDLGSDLLKARQTAAKIFKEVHGVTPHQAGEIADRVRQAAQACGSRGRSPHLIGRCREQAPPTPSFIELALDRLLYTSGRA
jgi:hypothetical protein